MERVGWWAGIGQVQIKEGKMVANDGVKKGLEEPYVEPYSRAGR